VAKSCLDTMWLEHAGKLPVERLCATMDAVISRLAGGELMMTAFVVEIDPSRRVLSYCSAGHNPQLLVRAGAGRPEVVALFERSLRIGDGAGTDFRVKTAEYRAGDRLVLYTDGLVEHRDATLDDGLARLLAVAPDLAARPVSELCDEIRDRMAPDLTDDIALLARRVRDVEPPPG
jgi:serine phosphatase RsbU (regulator of sigma subunit)